MEAQIEALQREFPHIDRMMAETLLKLHAQGRLAQHLEEDKKEENLEHE